MGNSTDIDNPVFWVGQYLMQVDMFPVFFTGHAVIACLIVIEDSKDIRPKFAQNHPFASWLCTIITGLSGVFVLNFLFGNPIIDILKEELLIIILTGIWYMMNFSPYNIVYKIAVFPPIVLFASALQECLRVRFVYLGILQASKVYPNARIILLLAGVINGNGYGFMRMVERLMRGKWTPSTNEVLEVTYFAKSGLYVSVAFLLHHLEFLTFPIEYLYLGMLSACVVLRMMIMVLKIQDPLLPLETPICTLVFGSGDESDVKADKTKSNQEEHKDKTENKKSR